MLGGFFGQFDARRVKIPLRFLKKKPIGATQFKQKSPVTKASYKTNTVRELAPKHRLRTNVIGIAIAAPTGKVLARVVANWVKSGGFRAAKSAVPTLPDVTVANTKTVRMISGFGAGRA